MSDRTEELPKPKSTFKRADDFLELYANNTQLFSSLWDLRIIFGQIEPEVGEDGVLQHASVRIPWSQVKILTYFLRVHLRGHEIEHGRVPVGSGLIPEIPPSMPKELAEKNPQLAKHWHNMRELYEEFISENPEAK